MKIPRLGRLGLALALAAASPVVLAGCGDKNKGSKKVKKGGDQEGKTAEALVAEAEAAAAAGDIEGADAKYAEAFKVKPDYAILEVHVRFLLDHKKTPAAVETSKVYYDNNPTDPRGSHLYAEALLVAGDYTTALGVAEELVALDDNDAAAHEKKGRALVAGGQVDAGVEELRRAVALDPKSSRFMVELGAGLHKAGKVDEAALQLRAAITIDPDNGRALMLLGLALRDQAELEEAEVFLVQATKKSKDAQPWFELGITQNRRGDDLGAESSLARAVGIEPDNSLYQYAYGEMLRFNKKYDEAIEAYRKANELDPPHPKASAKLGLALFEAQRLGEAELFLTDAIRKDEKNPFNYYNLAIVYREQKKTKLAIEMYEKFLELASPDDGDRAKADACAKALKRKRKCD
jgi:tetratricopeptide (TPR) repeat protein